MTDQNILAPNRYTSLKRVREKYLITRKTPTGIEKIVGVAMATPINPYLDLILTMRLVRGEKIFFLLIRIGSFLKYFLQTDRMSSDR